MSLLLDNDFHHRIDLFEPGDKTALICVDVPEVQRLVVENLTEIEYKIHTGLFLEDILLKLQTHSYDVVVVAEHFNASNKENNPILDAIRNIQANQRRGQMVVLVGSSVHTDSEMDAWALSVDLVLNLSDVPNLKHVVRRAVTRRNSFYKPLIEAYEAAGTS
jgi:CheY-like chemotaxis protein